MPVGTGNELKRHMQGTHLVIFITTGRTKSASAAKGNMFELTTMRAAKDSPTLRIITAMNHLVDIVDDRISGTNQINEMFVVIGKDCLKDVFLMHNIILQQSETKKKPYPSKIEGQGS